jgi:MSHA biogenesis protein MshP
MNKQRGFGMIAAIVILVIFAALSGYIVTLSSSQNLGAALDLQGTQAYFAAEAGLEWAKCQTQPICNGYVTPPTPCTPATNLTISGYTVMVSCTVANAGTAVEAGLGSIYLLTAVACNSPSCPNTTPGPLYVERKLSGLIENSP